MEFVVEFKNGFISHYEDVFKIEIIKLENKNTFKVIYGDLSKKNELIPIREIEFAYLKNNDYVIFKYKK